MIIPVHGEGSEPLELLEVLDATPSVGEIWLVEAPGDPSPVPEIDPELRKVRRVSALHRGRASQMNFGAELASGATLLFLHADCRVAPEAIEQLGAFFSGPGPAAASFRLDFREPGWGLGLLAWVGRLLAFVSPYAFGDQGLAVRRERFLAEGAFPEVPLFEDWIVVRRYRGDGGFCILSASCATSGRRFLRNGVLRQLWRNLTLLYRYADGVPIDELAVEYPPDVVSRSREGPGRVKSVREA